MRAPAALRTSFAGRLALIVVLALALRVGYVMLVEDEPNLSGDAFYYHQAANLLADGKGFIDPYRYLFGGREEVELADGTTRTVVTPVGHVEPTAGHPPVYVVYLGAVSSLGLRSITAHQLASALLGTTSVALAGLLGRRLVGNRTGLIAAGLTATYAFIWINDALVMSETAAITAAFGASLAGLVFWQRPTPRAAVLLGAVGALAALTRAELALFTPVVAIAALGHAQLSWRARGACLGVVAVTALAVVSPWVIRNLVVFEEPVLLSNGAGTVLVQANCDATYYGRHLGYWDLQCGQPQPYGPRGELLDESQRDVVVRERALGYIGDHLGRLATVVVPARVGRMWGIYEPIEQLRLDVVVEHRSLRISLLGYAQYVALVPLAAAGAWLLWRRRLPLLPVALWPVIVTVTAAMAFGNTRYRTAAEVALVTLAAVTLDSLAQRWSRARAAPAPAPADSPIPPRG